MGIVLPSNLDERKSAIERLVRGEQVSFTVAGTTYVVTPRKSKKTSADRSSNPKSYPSGPGR